MNKGIDPINHQSSFEMIKEEDDGDSENRNGIFMFHNKLFIEQLDQPMKPVTRTLTSILNPIKSVEENSQLIERLASLPNDVEIQN